MTDVASIVSKTAPCPRCGAVESVPVATARDYLYGVPGEFNAVSCARCGLWRQNPRPVAESLSAIYPDNYLPYDSPRSERPAASFVRRVVRAINPIRRYIAKTSLYPEFVPGGRLLELGCASGGFLVALRERGWAQLFGVELSPTAAAKARSLGFDVKCEMLESALADYPDAHFDVIVTSMVLEHLYDPFAVIRQIAAKLKPGGQFLFSTIVRDSLDARIYGKYWAGFDMPRHMVYVTQRDLLEALVPDFHTVRFRRQIAWIDFVRSSSWRRAAGDTRMIDRVVAAIPSHLLGQFIGLPLAWWGFTSRISVRARRH